VAFKVNIINIENNVNNILLTDDLTIEILKVRYNWILNASIKNVVLGMDDYGLVWYMGEWICGEWEDGTWYGGIFHDGIWKNGRWYSYLLDKPMILTKRFVVIEEDKKYSQFLNGKWYNGQWYNGIFGNDDVNISGKTSGETLSENIGCPYWYNGNWYNGLFKNSVWKNGIFYNGSFKNSYWLNGKFYNGTFDNYQWWNGNFYGGDFWRGIWSGGTFNQIDTNIKARFGTYSGTTYDGTLSTWVNGAFEKGEFMSGLYKEVSGNTIPSLCHHTAHWQNGVFNNGTWWGGHFEKGLFNYGDWYGGVFNTSIDNSYTQFTTWKNGNWYGGLWLNGTFKSGFFYDGMWLNGIFENGYLVSLFTGNMPNSVPSVLPAPPTPPTYTLATVTTDSISNISNNSGVTTGTVTSDGGGSSPSRGICYSVNPLPTISDTIVNGGSGLGTFNCNMTLLVSNTTYYVRAWVTNAIGTSYGSVLTFTTSVSTGLPTVVTLPLLPDTVNPTLTAKITSDGGSSITAYGFYLSLNPNPLIGGNYNNLGTYSGSFPPDLGFITVASTLLPLSTTATKYYLAYTTNSNGTSYGNILTY